MDPRVFRTRVKLMPYRFTDKWHVLIEYMDGTEVFGIGDTIEDATLSARRVTMRINGRPYIEPIDKMSSEPLLIQMWRYHDEGKAR